MKNLHFFCMNETFFLQINLHMSKKSSIFAG